MVRFDDRLQTVLRQPASDRHDAAVRWRQLVDLIARAGPLANSETVNEALTAIRADAARLEEPLRAAAARAIAALPLPLGLLECFITDKLTVSAPILAAASLEPTQWAALLALADTETRRFVETLHPELGTAPDDRTDELVDADPLSKRSTISDVVARIERRRTRRPVEERRGLGAAPFPTADLGVFRWECGPSGDIGWVEGAPRGALIGRSIARGGTDGGDRVDEAALRAFTQRAPFRDAELIIAGQGTVSGRWKISGVPAFDSAEGRFAGYRGIALREVAGPRPQSGVEHLPIDGDSMRELVHEIKTPLNAIIGFAEIIDGQYLGPAGRRYRQRATGIVDQARLLLTAIDDLDFAARVRSGVSPASDQADLAAIAAKAVEGLSKAANKRGVALVLAAVSGPVGAAIDSQSAARLIERVIDAAVLLAESGERLRVSIARGGGKAKVSVTRPRAIDGGGDGLWGKDRGGDDDPGRFSLRLARGLARFAGCELVLSQDEITLAFAAA